MANVKSWKDEVHDIAVAIKIDSLEDCKAHIGGWLYAKEVEKLPIHDWGKGDAYWTYLDTELVNGNRESEISGYSSPKLKPLNSAPNIMEELLSYPNSQVE